MPEPVAKPVDMAIYYWDRYSAIRNTRNFGDDLNPWFLPKLFSEKIIERRDVCLIGIGSLLDQKKMDGLRHYDKKVVFSSGAGYGPVPACADSSWDVACVRGPETARALGLPEAKAITDGAVLITDVLPGDTVLSRAGTVFVPHINTHLQLGAALGDICAELGFDYVSPDMPPQDFVAAIRGARRAVCEAMHGAIVADAVRTPWACVKLLHHNSFKWRDWCTAMAVPYRMCDLGGVSWHTGSPVTRGVNKVRRTWWLHGLPSRLRDAGADVGDLSDDALLEEKRRQLYRVIAEINAAYG